MLSIHFFEDSFEGILNLIWIVTMKFIDVYNIVRGNHIVVLIEEFILQRILAFYFSENITHCYKHTTLI